MCHRVNVREINNSIYFMQNKYALIFRIMLMSFKIHQLRLRYLFNRSLFFSFFELHNILLKCYLFICFFILFFNMVGATHFLFNVHNHAPSTAYVTTSPPHASCYHHTQLVTCNLLHATCYHHTQLVICKLLYKLRH